MSRHIAIRTVVRLAALALVVVSCTSDPGPQDATTLAEGSTTTAPALQSESSGSAEPVAPMALEEYLVTVVNTDADAGECGRRAEDELNTSFEFGDDPSEEQQIEYARRYIAGQQACVQQGLDILAALTPPEEALGPHEALLSARRALLTEWRSLTNAAATLDQFASVVWGPLEGPEFEAYAAACRGVVEMAADHGFDADLGCPVVEPGDTSTPVRITVVIEDSGWSVEPSSVVEYGRGEIEVWIDNRTERDQFVVTVDIFSGNVEELPTVDGILDTERCNQIFGDEDPATAPASFGCPGLEGEGAEIEVEQIFPGQSTLYDVGLFPGTRVYLDFQPGGYESGNYAAVEVIETAGT